MTGISQGMSIEEVETLGRRLQGVATDFDRWIQELERLVGGVTWVGPDAEMFKRSWWPQHRGRLTGVRQDLHGFGQSALNNAAEQRHASDGGDGGAVSLVVGTGAAGVAGAVAAGGGATTPAPASGSEGAGFSDSDFRGAGPEFLADWQQRGEYDQWGFGYDGDGDANPGDCTSFVAWRLNELAEAKGIDGWQMNNSSITGQTAPLGDGRLGNAATWGPNASAAGFAPDDVARPGAVAWWGANSGMGSYGHVGVVRSIDPGTGAITIEESSWDKSTYALRTVQPGGPGYPTGFIHMLPGS
jgi:CHAP domain-containing protein